MFNFLDLFILFIWFNFIGSGYEKVAGLVTLTLLRLFRTGDVLVFLVFLCYLGIFFGFLWSLFQSKFTDFLPFFFFFFKNVP